MTESDDERQDRLRRAAPHVLQAMQAAARLRETGEIAKLDMGLLEATADHDVVLESLRSQVRLARESADAYRSFADHLDAVVQVFDDAT